MDRTLAKQNEVNKLKIIGMDNQMNEKIEAVVTKIFYSVASNGKVEASINAGINDVKNLLAGYAAATSESDAVAFMTWAKKHKDYDYNYSTKTWDENTGHDDFEQLTHQEFYERFKELTGGHVVKGDECHCGSKNIRWGKAEIEIGDNKGSVATIQFKYCDDCGWRDQVDWYD